jgi:hypothetical protein
MSRQIPAFDGIRGLRPWWVVRHNATSIPIVPSPRALHLFPPPASRSWTRSAVVLCALGLSDHEGSARGRARTDSTGTRLAAWTRWHLAAPVHACCASRTCRDELRRRLGAVGAAALLMFLAGVLLPAFTTSGGYRARSSATPCSASPRRCLRCLKTWAALAGSTAANPVVSLLVWGPLRSLGKYSYAIYVFHNLSAPAPGRAPWLTRWFGVPAPLPAVMVYPVAVLPISWFLAFCSCHQLEKHFLRLKRLFEPCVASTAVA